ncbi:hypothetical protein CMK11_03745 [Candidatus Poribacteria bacterium]|nr:hypothetical protein [Candidatus Poribacteria bacterium]
MSETDLASVMEQVVREVLQRLAEPAGPAPAHASAVAVVLSASAGDAALRAVGEAVERGHHVARVGVSARTPASVRALAAALPADVVCGSTGGNELPSGVRAVVAPGLSLGDAAKLATGILDDIAPEWLWEALAGGVPVLASPGRGFDVPAGSTLARVADGVRAACERLGVQWRDSENLPIALSAQVSTGNESGTVHIPSGRGVLVTETMVANLAEGATELVAPMGAVVTPLARDLAKRRGIRVRLRT